MEDWQCALRRLFPVCEKTVYLEGAAFNGGCLAAKEGLEQWFSHCCSAESGNKAAWNRIGEETKALLAELLGAESPRQIAFTKNTSEGINILAQGFPWKAGDNVVVAEVENTSDIYPWLALREKGVEVRLIPRKYEALSPALYEERMDSRTRIVAVSHLQAPTGYLHDLRALSSLCRKFGSFLAVDAIQSLGAVPFSAEKWGVDAVCAGVHKNLFAFPGLGLLYLSPRLLPLVKPVFLAANRAVKVDYENRKALCRDEKDAAKFELSNLNYPDICALHSCLLLLKQVGVENIAAHIAGLSEMLYKGLQEQGYCLATPQDPKQRATIISLSVPDPEEMRQYFLEKNVRISHMDAGYIRLSLAAYSNRADVQAALRAAEAYRKEKMQ